MGRESNRHLCQSDKHLSLSFSETEIRNSMAKLSENENFGRLFAYGFGAHHLWVAQRMITDPEKVMENRLLIVEF